MEREKLTEIFKAGAQLSTDEESVLFGEIYAPDVPDGIEAVMQYHCLTVDSFLRKLPRGSIKARELFAIRGFTLQEYQALFDLSIREWNFYLHPVFRSLRIISESQRRKIIYPLQKEKHNDYWQLLASCLARFNPSLLTFFFRTHPVC